MSACAPPTLDYHVLRCSLLGPLTPIYWLHVAGWQAHFDIVDPYGHALSLRLSAVFEAIPGASCTREVYAGIYAFPLPRPSRLAFAFVMADVPH